MKIFLDANVLFSASLPESRIAVLLEILQKRHHRCVSNDFAIEEARRNLLRLYPNQLSRLAALLATVERVPVAPLRESCSLPEKDMPILGGAIAGECTHLMTGDERHFGPLYGSTISGVKIISPKQLAIELGLGVR